LGIDIPKSDFEFVGEHISDISNEIGQVYFLYLNKDYDFKLEKSEVEQVKWVTLDEFKEIFGTELFPPYDNEYLKMVKELLTNKLKNKTQE